MIEEWTALEAVLPRWVPPKLGGPATPQQLADLQEKIGFKVPEIAELLAIRNSARAIEVEWSLLSCDKILAHRDEMVELRKEWMKDDADEGSCHEAGNKQVYWNPKWVQFATDDGDNPYCVDYDPAPSGFVGQIILWDALYACILAPSLKQWLIDERESILPIGQTYQMGASYKIFGKQFPAYQLSIATFASMIGGVTAYKAVSKPAAVTTPPIQAESSEEEKFIMDFLSKQEAEAKH